MSTQASLGGLDGSITPLPQPGVAVSLIASATLSQDFNDAISDVVSVKNARRVVLIVKHDADDSASDGVVHTLVMLSNANDAPAIGDDSWDALPFYDTSSTDADIAAGVTLPTDADITKGPNWRKVAAGGLLLLTEPASSSEKVRQRFTIDVADARWMYVACVQQGDTTNFGTVAVDWAVCT